VTAGVRGPPRPRAGAHDVRAVEPGRQLAPRAARPFDAPAPV